MAWWLAVGLAFLAPLSQAVSAAETRPNIVLVITDDQGYGDLGLHGNPILRTPELDRLARDGLRLDAFYVQPVCSPTRAGLLTGRYAYRTGVTDTYVGRSMMRGEEITLAERLRAAGFRTGIFGKWHLGDCYPLRPQDQGFDECLVHGGGGIGQPADPPDNHYQDPQLLHNGHWQRRKGYCSDIFTSAAIDFLAADRERPWFVYLAFNCPHAPLEAPDGELAEYSREQIQQAAWPNEGRQVEGRVDLEATRRVYAMVANLDANLGRLLARLDTLGQRENTIVIFLTDNGPQQPRYVSGLRGLKGTVYEGGVRVPCFLRWPARLPAGEIVRAPISHIDLLPTLLAACSIPAGDTPLDGRNVLAALEHPGAPLADRPLFFQWHRGDLPERYRNAAVRRGRWKLVQPRGGGDLPLPAAFAFELFDLETDPYEQHDRSGEQPEIVQQLRAEYDAWFDDVTRDLARRPDIIVGSDREPRTILTWQDWRGPGSGWQAGSVGHWDLAVERPARFHVEARFKPVDQQRELELRFADQSRQATIAPGALSHRFEQVELPVGRFALSAILTAGERRAGANYVEIAVAE